MYENGYGVFLQYTSSYESYEAYSSLEEAKEVARDERGIDISNPETRVSLGVGEHGGQNWFVVAPDGIFMDCTVAELDDWEDWYQEDWIETLYVVEANGISYESDFDRLSLVKDEADKWISYCQSDLTINKDNEVVAIRRWYGVEPTEEDKERDIIQFGSFGFYDEWEDVERF